MSTVDLRLHLANREDVVVIFVDMDSSIFRTDLALPFPLGAAGKDCSGSTRDGARFTGGGGADGACEALTAGTGRRKDTFSPARTRCDIARHALRSFVAQKQRISPNASTSLWFALYAVWDEVVELLPLTRGDLNAIDVAIGQNIRANAPLTRPQSLPLGPFPFHAIASVLRCIEVKFATGKTCSRNGLEGGSRDYSSSAVDATTAAADGVAMSARQGATRSYNVKLIQGVVLLNRDCAPPISAEPPAVSDGESIGVGAVVRRCLDVISLGNIRQPLPPLKMPKTRPDLPPRREEPGGSNNNNNIIIITDKEEKTATKGRETSSGSIREPMTMDAMEVDCPCSIVDLASFTGVPHRGLALGCALTKLLAPHNHGNSEFFLAQPVHRINLPLPVKARPRQQHQQHTDSGELREESRAVSAKRKSLGCTSSV